MTTPKRSHAKKKHPAGRAGVPGAMKHSEIDELLLKPRDQLQPEEVDKLIAELTRRREIDMVVGPQQDPWGEPSLDDEIMVEVPLGVAGHVFRIGRRTYPPGKHKMKRSTYAMLKSMVWENSRSELERLSPRGNMANGGEGNIRHIELRDMI